MKDQFLEIALSEQVDPILKVGASSLRTRSDSLAFELVVVATWAGLKQVRAVLL
jgi:hypothetical protein